MQTRFLLQLLCVGFVATGSLYASIEDIGGPQGEYEKEIGAVVRNKRFYKAGHLEVLASVGTFPYDSVASQLAAGAILTWYWSDHFGWEIINGSLVSSKVATFAKNTASDPNYKLKRLDVLQLKTIASTNLVVSPLYTKIRFFGSQVVYFDLYVVAGIGAAQTQTDTLSYQPSALAQSVANAGWDPMFNVGLGIKIFASRSFGITLDLRDYVTHSTKYDERGLVSNFAVQAGLSMFIPSF